MAINAEDALMSTRLPDALWGRRWRRRIDTASDSGEPGGSVEHGAGEVVEVAPRSLVLLEHLADEHG
jgi:hypothetical protein